MMYFMCFILLMFSLIILLLKLCNIVCKVIVNRNQEGWGRKYLEVLS